MAPNEKSGILLNPDTIIDIEDLKERKDKFGFEEKAGHFIDYINNYLRKRKSIVVGIYGTYGSGKSVFVNLVKDKIKETQ